MREGIKERWRKIQDMGRASAVELLNELCERLRQIGVNATVFSVSGSNIEAMEGMLIGNVVGCVKVEDRNIDLVQLERVEHGSVEDSGSGPFGVYYCHYVVQANVEGLEDKLNAKAKSITKGFLSREIVDFRWEGGELAQRLNADAELRNMLLREGLDKLPNIEVKPHKKPKHVPGIGKPPKAFLDAQASFKQCVRITKRPKIPGILGAYQMFEVPGTPILEGRVGVELPTRETFETYERIAQHIRNIVNSQA